eukprot:6845488-Prymnesium_polylepis.1
MPQESARVEACHVRAWQPGQPRPRLRPGAARRQGGLHARRGDGAAARQGWLAGAAGGAAARREGEPRVAAEPLHGERHRGRAPPRCAPGGGHRAARRRVAAAGEHLGLRHGHAALPSQGQGTGRPVQRVEPRALPDGDL